CVRTQCSTNLVGIDQTTAVDWYICDINSLLLQMLAGIEHRMVLDRRTDDVVAWTNQSKYREIVTLRAATGKHHLRRTAAEQSRHRFARTFYGCTRLLAMVMDRRSVAESLAKIRPHCLQNFR